MSVSKLLDMDVEIHQLQEELEHEQAERTRAVEQLHQKDTELEQARTQLQQKATELDSVQQSLQRLCADLEDREARLRAQEEEMQQKDAEINRLMAELRRCQAQLQTPLSELKLPLKLEWRKGKDMPTEMGGAIQAVVIGRDVYVGGGEGLNVETVMVYSLQTRTWTKLPYENRFFGMAVVNNQLVLVGGQISSTRRMTNVLGLWDERSQTWTHPFPVMPTARHSLSVISYQKWLVTAGGTDGRGSYSNKVELLDTLSRQWYEGSPLPMGCIDMSSAISGNMWYLSGGYIVPDPNMHVFSVCLDVLISQAVSQSAGTTSLPTPSPWQTLTELPVKYSTALIIRGSLLTVGGEVSSEIHLYQPSRRSWVKVGDLPTQRWVCACIVLPSGEIFVAGGNGGGSSFLPYISSVDIATIV